LLIKRSLENLNDSALKVLSLCGLLNTTHLG
jgi:hypothetical protein